LRGLALVLLVLLGVVQARALAQPENPTNLLNR
jgi:hypothetical protein